MSAQTDCYDYDPGVYDTDGMDPATKRRCDRLAVVLSDNIEMRCNCRRPNRRLRVYVVDQSHVVECVRCLAAWLWGSP